MKRDRGFYLLLLFIIFFLIAVIRLADLEIIHTDFYKEKAKKQRSRKLNLAADRGDIVDRKGRMFATSLDSFSVYINPRIFKNYGLLSKLIDETVAPFDKKKHFVWVKRKIGKETAKKIIDAKIEGVNILVEKKRVYPKGHLASQILGFVGLDNEGLSGLELSCEKYLKGKEGQILTESDPMGHELLFVKERDIQEASPGMKLTLTIDEAIQYLAEQELEAALKSFKAESGNVLVMDIKTGEILALAGKPDFDPNEYYKFNPKSWRSFAVDVYEPGSTFKVITAVAGLDYGAINPDSKLKAMDSITLGGKTIKNSHQILWDGSYVTISKMLEKSINTGAAQIGIKLGKEKFYNKIKSFGFGELQSIGLPGESRGLLRPPADWSSPDIGMITFGQGIAVTPIQLLSAFSSLGNQGRRLKPILIKKIESPDGLFIKSFSMEEVNRPVSKKTADEATKLLENVVLYGSGHKAGMRNYRVGGKTGTAQKAAPGGRGYMNGRFIASFVGFAPLSDPRIAALVIINEPKTTIWGETVAGPVFKNVVEGTLRYLNTAPDMVK